MLGHPGFPASSAIDGDTKMGHAANSRQSLSRRENADALLDWCANTNGDGNTSDANDDDDDHDGASAPVHVPSSQEHRLELCR